MAIAVPMMPVAIPVSPAEPMPNPWQTNYQQPYHYVESQQLQQYAHYPQDLHHAYHNTVPTPVSGALPVQAGPTYVEHRHYATEDQLEAIDEAKYPWTTTMDDILVDRHEKKWKWEQISQQCFAGRKSANACRKRHSRVLFERSRPARWDEDKTAYMLKVCTEDLRKRMWSLYAEAAGNGVTWQDCEEFAYSQGSKAMTGKPALINRHSMHRRQKSRARSQQSRHSISSDTTQQLPLEDEEQHDTSGLSNETQGSFQLPPLQQQNLHLSPHHSQHYHAPTSYGGVSDPYGAPESYYHGFAT